MGCNQSCLAGDHADDYLPYPDINGPGILLSFFVSIALSLAACFALNGLGRHGFRRRTFLWLLRRAEEGEMDDQYVLEAITKLRRFILTLSDQQLVTGIGISLATYISICEIQVWHFLLSSHLSFVSFAVHILTLHTLRDQFHANLSDWRCRLRLFLVCVNTVLVIPSLYHITLTHAVQSDVSPELYPAICLFSSFLLHFTTAGGWAGFGIVLLFIVFTMTSVFFYVSIDFEGEKRRFRRKLERASRICLFLSVLLTLGTSMERIFANHGRHPISIGGWGFGQILPVAMLFLALLSVGEIRGL